MDRLLRAAATRQGKVGRKEDQRQSLGAFHDATMARCERRSIALCPAVSSIFAKSWWRPAPVLPPRTLVKTFYAAPGRLRRTRPSSSTRNPYPQVSDARRASEP